jgi:integrase/recombinase XerD
MRLSEAIKQYVGFRRFQMSHKALPNDIAQLFQFAVFMRDASVEAVRLQHIQEYLGLWSETGIDQNTVFRKANSFKQFFGFLHRQGYEVMHPDLLPKIKILRHQPRVTTEEEYRKFINAIPATGYHNVRNAAFVSTLYDTFARVNEILPLRLQHIGEDMMGATIKTEKVFDGDMRRVFWRDETKTYLVRWLNLRESILRKKKLEDLGEVWITVGGGFGATPTYRQVAYSSMLWWFHRYSREANLDRILNPHSLRHKGAVEMSMQNLDPYSSASILGHRSIESTMDYRRLYGEDLKRKYYGIKSGS